MDPLSDQAIQSSVNAIERKLREDIVFGGSPSSNPKGYESLLICRRAVARWVSSRYVHWALGALVILNTIALALFDPSKPGSSATNSSLSAIGVAVNVIFACDVLLKVFAFGITGNYNFFADPWNIADSALVTLGFVALGVQCATAAVSQLQDPLTNIILAAPGVVNLSGLRFLRILGWLYAEFSGVRLVLIACYKSLPGLGGVFVLSLMTYVAFALVGIEIWPGVLGGICGYELSPGAPLTAPSSIQSVCSLPCTAFSGRCSPSFGDTCDGFIAPVANGTVAELPGTCFLPVTRVGSGRPSFDNLGTALLVAFVLPTTEGWSSIMYTLWHAWGLSSAVSVIFATHVLLGSWFILELNFAVVSGEYDAASELEDDRAHLLREIFQVVRCLSDEDLYTQRRVLEEDTSLAQMTVDTARATTLADLDTALILWQAYLVGCEAAGGEVTLGNPRRQLQEQSYDSTTTVGNLPKTNTLCFTTLIRIQAIARMISSSTSFNVAAMVVIVANAVLLGCEHFGASAEMNYALTTGNYCLTALFAVEMAFRLCAYGKDFWHGPSGRLHVVEMCVLLLSILDIVGQASGLSAQHASLNALRVVRAIRVMRVVRLFTSWMSVFDSIVLATVPALNALTVLIVFLVSMALVGMQAFGSGYDAAVAAGAISATPRLNFQTFWWALITVYDVADNENWNDTLYTHVAAFGPSAAVFLLVIICVGNYLFLNVVLAILVRGFELARVGPNAESASLAEDVGKSFATLKAWMRPLINNSSAQEMPSGPSGVQVELPKQVSFQTDHVPGNAHRVSPLRLNVRSDRHITARQLSFRVSASPPQKLTPSNSQQSRPSRISVGSERSRHTVASFDRARPLRNCRASASMGFKSDAPKIGSIRRFSLPLSQQQRQCTAISSNVGSCRRFSLPGSSLRQQPALPPAQILDTQEGGIGSPHIHENDVHFRTLPRKAKPRASVRTSLGSAPSALGVGDVPMIALHKAPRRSIGVSSVVGRNSPREVFKAPSELSMASDRSRMNDDDPSSAIVVLLEAPSDDATIQRIHAFVPQAGVAHSTAADDDDRIIEFGDGVSFQNGDNGGLLISISSAGEIDARHVREPCTLREEKVLDDDAQRLVDYRQRDLDALIELSAMTAASVGAGRDSIVRNLRLRWAKFRLWSAKLVTNRTVEYAMLILIVLSCASLMVDSGDLARCTAALDSSCVARTQLVSVMDTITTTVFVLELAFNIAARGAFSIARDQDAYFSSGWRILDAVIIATCLVSSFTILESRALRAARALRVLRLIVRVPNLQLVASALVTAVPRLRHVFAVVFLFMFCFAVIGVLSFGGAMATCTDPTISSLVSCEGTFNTTGDMCGYQPNPDAEASCRMSLYGKTFPRVWETFPSTTYAGESFDDVGHALLVVFELLTGENWPVIMGNAIDGDSASGHNVGTIVRNENPAGALYFVLSQLILNSFLVDLFTGAVIDQYKRMCDAAKGIRDPLDTSKLLLTAAQQTWVSNARTIITLRPTQQVISKSTLQVACFKLVTAWWFEWVIGVTILANLAFLSLRHANEDPYIDFIQLVANAVLLVLFTLEVSMKLFGLGWRQFIDSGWNAYDVIILFASAVGAAFDVGTLGLLLRSLRVFRLFRIIRVSATLTHLASTFMFCLRPFVNVLLVLGAIFFIYAVVGMQLFAGIRQSDKYYLSKDANFESFSYALITLVRCSTGENWNGIMYALAVTPPFCDTSPPYENCGWNVAVPAIYFVSFFFMTSVTFVSLLTAVILKAFEDSKQLSTGTQRRVHSLTLDEAEAYSRFWSSMGPTSSWWLSEADVVEVIAKLPWPLGTLDKSQDAPLSSRRKASSNMFLSPRSVRSNDRIAEERLLARDLLRQLPVVPNASGQLHFHAVLLALVEAASTNPPLGSGTHAIVVNVVASKASLLWRPRWWCQRRFHSNAHADARAADIARFVSAMGPREALRVERFAGSSTYVGSANDADVHIDMYGHLSNAHDVENMASATPSDLGSLSVVQEEGPVSPMYSSQNVSHVQRFSATEPQPNIALPLRTDSLVSARGDPPKMVEDGRPPHIDVTSHSRKTLRSVFEQRRAAMSTISSRFLVHQRSLQMRPTSSAHTMRTMASMRSVDSRKMEARLSASTPDASHQSGQPTTPRILDGMSGGRGGPVPRTQVTQIPESAHHDEALKPPLFVPTLSPTPVHQTDEAPPKSPLFVPLLALPAMTIAPHLPTQRHTKRSAGPLEREVSEAELFAAARTPISLLEGTQRYVHSARPDVPASGRSRATIRRALVKDSVVADYDDFLPGTTR